MAGPNPSRVCISIRVEESDIFETYALREIELYALLMNIPARKVFEGRM